MLPAVPAMVTYIDERIENAQLALNRIGGVPVSGLVTGLPRAVIGGGQIVTAVAVSVLSLANQEEAENQRLIRYDGIERASRGAVNIFLGVAETAQAAAVLVNPVALFYLVFEYSNRHR